MKFPSHISLPDLYSYGTIFLVANAVVVICTIITIFAILIDFVQYHQPKVNKKKVNSWIETGSMFVYFFIYYLLMHVKSGRVSLNSEAFANLLYISGSVLIIVGCYVNVKGRFALKHNWANQATIYHDHTLVTGSIYRIVRHPLYASLIWMLLGGALIYFNYFSFLSVILIFLPMMYNRAKLEEKLLKTEFSEYATYQKQVGMFFPKTLKLW